MTETTFSLDTAQKIIQYRSQVAPDVQRVCDFFVCELLVDPSLSNDIKNYFGRNISQDNQKLWVKYAGESRHPWATDRQALVPRVTQHLVEQTATRLEILAKECISAEEFTALQFLMMLLAHDPAVMGDIKLHERMLEFIHGYLMDMWSKSTENPFIEIRDAEVAINEVEDALKIAKSNNQIFLSTEEALLKTKLHTAIHQLNVHGHRSDKCKRQILLTKVLLCEVKDWCRDGDLYMQFKQLPEDIKDKAVLSLAAVIATHKKLGPAEAKQRAEARVDDFKFTKKGDLFFYNEDYENNN